MADEEKKTDEGEKAGGGMKALIVPVAASAVTAAIVGFLMVFLFAPKPAPAPSEEEQLEAEVAGGHGEKAGGHGEKPAAGGHGEKAGGGHGGGHGEEKKHTGNYHQYDSIVVSIFDREKVHYLRIKVALELANAKVKEEIEIKDPQIRDSMIFVLGDFTVRELLDNQAKLLVKEVLLKTMNKILGKGKVIDVYFTEFVVQ